MAAYWFFVVSGLVIVAGIVLARSADRIGVIFGLQRSVTGFILLAGATSLPELVISCRVAQSGAVDMAVGGILGSCLINLVILAVVDLSQRSRRRMFNRQAAAHSLAAMASVLLAAIAAVAVLVPKHASIGRIEWASVAILVGYFLTVRLIYNDQICRQSEALSDELEKEDETQPPDEEARLRPIWYYLGATAAIFFLANPLASSSDSLATWMGLSGTFFGAVFLAFVTSLPEMVTTAQATRMEAQDLAISNIFGSNAFNLVILAAIDLFTEKPLYSQLSSVHAMAAIGVIVTTTIAVMGLLYRAEKRIWYLEPDAAAVIAFAVGFYYLIYIM